MLFILSVISIWVFIDTKVLVVLNLRVYKCVSDFRPCVWPDGIFWLLLHFLRYEHTGNVFFSILTDSVRKLHPISIRINMPPCFPFRTVCIDGISVFLVRFHLEETRKRKSDNPEGTRIFGSSREWLCCCAEPRGPHDERTVRESDLQQCLDTQKRC